ncbi:hypothetical protein RJ640_009152 [Escallonia rubra]|uniref:VWFA domain-containing protein n=1 Tax=Escallonia rubra TaxID=112253 RepID=A0AA88RH53_9ASTE|nr:hypothetical protein RJ640_009152 [Escallonia rubra]
MADEFSMAVEDGIRLSKRLYFGKDRAVAPPRPMAAMDKSSPESSYLPAAPMVYAVISNPAIVDNPDVPSYQPHVHGRCDPPALIPLQMNGVTLEADCYLDTAFVTVTGSWRVHCVMGSRSCDCRVAIPMGEQGSILGIEVDVPKKSYCSQLVALDDKRDVEKIAKAEDGGFLKPHIFVLLIPEVDGGSNLIIKVRWSQKLLYQDGQFTLNIPFSFPEYVTPAGKKISKKEKIQLNVNSGPGTEVLCKTTSHPLKELRRQVGKLGFLYEAEVLAWSSYDFEFTYSVSSHTSGSVLLQSPSVLDMDQREMFCLYLLPGKLQNAKAFRKEVAFVVDISGSMRGKPLDDIKNALSAALLKLDPGDSFTVLAFNDETYLFSSSMLLATKEAIENATRWISMNFIAGGGTNILLALNQAIEMLSGTRNSLPVIFLVTDGSVEDERNICDVVKRHASSQGSLSPRIYTFGIGTFCNHYFLRMLALIGRGQHDAAYDADLIEARFEGLCARALSTVVANITIGGLDDLDGVEVYHSHVPDLLSESPLIVSGRYQGDVPDIIKARGTLSDLSNLAVDLKAQVTKDIPLNKVLGKQQIEIHTAQAWFSKNKDLEEKIVKMSVQESIVSEYTRMILLETEREMKATASRIKEIDCQVGDDKSQKIVVLQNLEVGFGNLIATAENTPPGSNEPKLPEAAEIFVRAASNFCGKLCGYCCCMCCIQTCSRMNDQCAIALTQLCGALACLGCFVCCEACCCGGHD